MRSHFGKSVMIRAVIAFIMVLLTGWGCRSALIKNIKVADIPNDRHERLIKLYNPEKKLPSELVGVVFVASGAKVCTDFPYEETIKSLDELNRPERDDYDATFTSYAIKDAGDVMGYVALRGMEYRILIWKNEKDSSCTYKVSVICIKNNNPGICGHSSFGVNVNIPMVP